MRRSMRSRKTDISTKVRMRVYDRDDNTCIFCRAGYHAPAEDRLQGDMGYGLRTVAHFIGRGRGGLGIEENLATVCVTHHQLLDNGSHGERPEMMEIFEDYLRSEYPEWSREIVEYRKEHV